MVVLTIPRNLDKEVDEPVDLLLFILQVITEDSLVDLKNACQFFGYLPTTLPVQITSKEAWQEVITFFLVQSSS